jgi:hypothetical protein
VMTAQLTEGGGGHRDGAHQPGDGAGHLHAGRT